VQQAEAARSQALEPRDLKEDQSLPSDALQLSTGPLINSRIVCPNCLQEFRHHEELFQHHAEAHPRPQRDPGQGETEPQGPAQGSGVNGEAKEEEEEEATAETVEEELLHPDEDSWVEILYGPSLGDSSSGPLTRRLSEWFAGDGSSGGGNNNHGSSSSSSLLGQFFDSPTSLPPPDAASESFPSEDLGDPFPMAPQHFTARAEDGSMVNDTEQFFQWMFCTASSSAFPFDVADDIEVPPDPALAQDTANMTWRHPDR